MRALQAFFKNAPLKAFAKALSTRSALYPNMSHPRWHRFGCYVSTLDLTHIEHVQLRSGTDTDEEDFTADPASATRTSSHPASSDMVDLVTIFKECPLLERVYLGAGTLGISTKAWNDLYSNLHHPKLVALRGVCLPHARPETAALIDLLNDVPQLEEFSATSLCLQADLSLSLIEVFRMNEKLVSRPAPTGGALVEGSRELMGCLGLVDQASHKTGLRLGGLRELSFGGDCDLPFTFVTAIPRACPNLRA